MKRKIILTIAICMTALFFVFGSCRLEVLASVSSYTDLNYVRGNMYYLVNTSDTIPNGITVTYATNLTKLLSGDNTKFDKNIAVTADILASDIYNDAKVGTKRSSYTKEECLDVTSIYYDQFGMDDATVFDLSQIEYTEDKDALTKFVAAHKKVTENGKEKEIIVVAIEGTNGTYAQWCNNFECGTEGDYHRGIEVTTQRVLDLLKDYISKNISTGVEKTILITGHSRGGSIANLLGKYFEGQTEYKSFTYTFAAPPVTTKTDTAASTIFNMVNTDDLIPYFPLSQWGFKRFGTDITFNVNEETSLWKNLTGIDYITCSGSGIVDKVLAIAENRSQIYEMNATPVMTKSYTTQAQATAYADQVKSKLAALNFTEDYVEFTVTEDTTQKKPYTVNAYICPGFLMEYISGLVTAEDRITYMGQVGSYIRLDKIESYNAVATYMVSKYLDKGIIHAHCVYAYYWGALYPQSLSGPCSHKFDDGVCLNYADCEGESVKMYTCLLCGGTQISSGSVLADHIWNSGTITNMSADSSAKSILYTCTVCGKTKTEEISSDSDHKEDANTTLANMLILKGKSAKKSIKYTWNRIENAVKYKLYVSVCGKEQWKCVKTTAGTSFTKKGLNPKNKYRAYVVAYDKNGNKLASTPTIHNALKSKKQQSNALAVKALKTATITIGSTASVNAKITKKDSSRKMLGKAHGVANIRYYSGDASIATVNRNGRVKGVKKGRVNIYSIAPDGYYAVTTVVVQ